MRAFQIKFVIAACIQFIDNFIAVCGGQMLADLAEQFAVARPQGTHLRLNLIGGKGTGVGDKLHILDVQLILDQCAHLLRQLKFRLDIHGRKRLTDLEVGAVARGTAQVDRFKDNFHILFQFRVDHRLVADRE